MAIKHSVNGKTICLRFCFRSYLLCTFLFIWCLLVLPKWTSKRRNTNKKKKNEQNYYIFIWGTWMDRLMAIYTLNEIQRFLLFSHSLLTVTILVIFLSLFVFLSSIIIFLFIIIRLWIMNNTHDESWSNLCLIIVRLCEPNII